MKITVRMCDGSHKYDFEVSKALRIESFRKLVEPEFNIEPSKQRLIFAGKVLEDGHTLHNYRVSANHTIVLSIKISPADIKSEVKDNIKELKNENTEETIQGKDEKETEVPKSNYYQVNDRIDFCDWQGDGAYYEAKIVKITKREDSSAILKSIPVTSNCDRSLDENGEQWLENNINNFGQVGKAADDGHTYHVLYEGFEDGEPEKAKIGHFRPRAWKKISFENVREGDRILANYNEEEPKKRGIFYDCTVISKSKQRNQKFLLVKVHIGLDENCQEDCKIIFIDDLLEIQKITCLSNRNPKLKHLLQSNSIAKRVIKPNCDKCKDRQSVKCKECGCKVCGGKHNPGELVLCDECNGAYHLACLDPPLTSLPNDPEWFCANCKIDETEIVRAGEKLKHSKKNAKMPSSNSQSKRDWGKGMACAGVDNKCNIVDKHHRGPIPGVEVGTNWCFRVQVSAAGVHRPPVGGIHGSAKTGGTLSITLSGGYEDDVDNGDEFFYTGSGGRDLSGNKRTAKQSFNQELTKFNLGLAVACNAPVNDRNGSESSNWMKGKEIRVVRADESKLKHSEYACEKGYRYDGIYKVVKYWPETGQSGFIVWRFKLRRDDPAPAPWTKEGKLRINNLGLTLIFPEGHEEGGEASGKRKSLSAEDEKEPKRTKTTGYKLPTNLKNLIKKDQANSRLWEECLAVVSEGLVKFNDTVSTTFQCICCCDLLHKPVTTLCNHNFCHACIVRGLAVNATCPTCRTALEKSDLKVNPTLLEILQLIFKGYDEGK